LLVGLRAPDGRPSADRPLVFDFAILVSGFASNDPDLGKLYARTDAYALPSLHIVGRRDAIVAPRSSRALAAHFASPTILEHGGGHVVAGDPNVTAGARAFLERARRIEREPLDVPLWAGRSAPRM